MELGGARADVVCQPLTVEMEHIQRSTKAWVKDQLPLELLTSRGREDPALLDDLRRKLWEPEIVRLIGLLAHLLYWLAFGCCKRPGEPRMGEHAIQGLCASAHELWVAIERKHRDASLGSTLAMPCVLLTLKTGVERAFEHQYPSLFDETTGEWGLRQELLARINTLIMRLFDPDGTFARFGRLDGSGEAIALSKKLDLLASATSQNRTKSKRLQGRANRATPLVRAALQAGQEEGGGKGANNPKTRTLLDRGELGGSAGLASVVAPPSDDNFRNALLNSAMTRVGVKKLPPVGKASPRASPAPQSAREARPAPGPAVSAASSLFKKAVLKLNKDSSAE